MKFGAVIPILNEWRFANAVIGPLLDCGVRVVILRGIKSFSGAPVSLTPIPKLDQRVTVVVNDWATEHETRNYGMEFLADCDYVFTVDSDEIMSVKSIQFLMKGCELGHRAIAARFFTWWKTTEFRIDPPEDVPFRASAPVVARKDVRFTRHRMITDGQCAMPAQFLMHHLSYVRTDDEVKEKLRLFGHASEVVPGWFDSVWQAWDNNHDLENLHPTEPAAYRRAVRAPSAELNEILKKYGCE